MGGSGVHRQAEVTGRPVGWSLRILGGGATPFRTWLALQTLLLDRGQACPLLHQVIGGPSGDDAAADQNASLDAAISSWEGADAVTAYCMGEGGLNASQAGAVLAAAAPSVEHGITLIQVRRGTYVLRSQLTCSAACHIWA